MIDSVNRTGPTATKRVVFAALGYTAGILGILTWGWIAATLFLLAGGAVGRNFDQPILPFMLLWGSICAGLGLALGLTSWLMDSSRARQAPWTWIAIELGLAALIVLIGWIALGCGA